MKRFLVLILIGFIPLAIFAQDQVVYDNALENGWADYSWATVNFSKTTPVHSGADSIQVTDPGTSWEAIWLHHTPFNSAPYQSLSFWIYPTVAGVNSLTVQATLNGTGQPAVYLSFTAGQLNQWQQVTLSLSSLGVASNAGFDGFWIQNSTGGANTFYLDDVSLVAVPSSNQVTVNVNSKSVIRTIDRRIYGMNLMFSDSYLSGTASPALLKSMGTGVIRFPGGSGSDDYDWQTDRSVSNGAFQWASNAVTFAQVAEAAGTQAYVTVNYGSGTPEQAAAWVAYYNGSVSGTASLGIDSKGRDWKTVGYWASIRSSSPLGVDDGYNFLRMAHPLPFGFRYWEVGNECYGTWEYDLHGAVGSGLTGIAYDPYTYAQSFRTFYSKMLAVDSTIKIGVPAIQGEDTDGIGTHAVANPNEGNSMHSGWTPVLLATLKAAGVTPDFLIYHCYPQEPWSESDSVLLQAGTSFQADAANFRKMINDYFGATSGSNIELAMTELNSVSYNPGKQTTSLVNGLFLADAIGSIASTEFNSCLWWTLRNGSYSVNNNSASLYGWRNYGDYGAISTGDVSEPSVNTPFPPFYAGKLLTHWGQGGDVMVSSSSSNPQLALYAAKTSNGNLTLLVINKYPSTDLNVQIMLNGFTPGAALAPSFSYGKSNDLGSADLTSGTVAISGSSFSHTFPAYSMTVLVLSGLFENWREQKFTPAELANASLSADSGQPAHDGILNLMKYALGLDPKVVSVSGLPVTSTQLLNGKIYPTLSFKMQSALTDINYSVEVSSDLIHWQSGTPYTLRIDDGSTSFATFRDLTAIQDGPKCFMRLRVTR